MSRRDQLWGWAKETLGDSFSIQNEWMRETREALLIEPLTCLVVPKACGDINNWAKLISSCVEEWTDLNPLEAGETVEDVLETVCHEFGLEYGGPDEILPSRIRRILAEARREFHHVEPRLLVAWGLSDTDCEKLWEFQEIQKEISLSLVRFLVVRRIPVLGNRFHSTRFSPPCFMCNLNMVTPSVEQDPRFWTDWYLTMTALWEGGGVPSLATELWEELRLERRYDITSAGFDTYIEGKVNEFSRQRFGQVNQPPMAILQRSMTTVDEDLWQSGSVVWRHGFFDLSPLHARSWFATVVDKRLAEIVRRRVLTNVPLSRWLSGWASSIEETLRLAALRIDETAVRNYFQGQQPAFPEGNYTNRYQELGQSNPILLIDNLNFKDLSGLVSRFFSAKSRGAETSLYSRLDGCRQARNRVVHKRRVSAADAVCLLKELEWLRKEGLH